jgi:hypothetical protein
MYLFTILLNCAPFATGAAYEPIGARAKAILQSAANRAPFLQLATAAADLVKPDLLFLLLVPSLSPGAIARIARPLMETRTPAEIAALLLSGEYDLRGLLDAFSRLVGSADTGFGKFLLANYQEIIFPCLFHSETVVQRAAGSLTFALLPSVRPPRGEPAQSAVIDNDVSADAIQLLNTFLSVTIPYVVANADSVSRVAFPLFANLVRWLLRRCRRLDNDSFHIVFRIYERFGENDTTFVSAVRLILAYPPDLVEPLYESICLKSLEKFPSFCPPLFGPLFRKAPCLSPTVALAGLNKPVVTSLFAHAAQSLPAECLRLFLPILPLLLPASQPLKDALLLAFSGWLDGGSCLPQLSLFAPALLPLLDADAVSKLYRWPLVWFCADPRSVTADPALAPLLAALSGSIGERPLPALECDFPALIASLACVRPSESVTAFVAFLGRLSESLPPFRDALWGALLGRLAGVTALSDSAPLLLLFAALARTAADFERLVLDCLLPCVFDLQTPREVFVTLRALCLKFENPGIALPILDRAIRSGILPSATRPLLFQLLDDSACYDELFGLAAALAEQACELRGPAARVALEYLAQITARLPPAQVPAFRAFLEDQIGPANIDALRALYPAQCGRVFPREAPAPPRHNSPVTSDAEN